MGRTKDLLEQPEHESDPAAAAERRADEAEEQLAWATGHPAEWREWARLQPLLSASFEFAPPGQIYDFPAFLAEVGACPSPGHTIQRRDETLPYGRGNLAWKSVVIVTAPAGPPRHAEYTPLGLAKELEKKNQTGCAWTIRRLCYVDGDVDDDGRLMTPETHPHRIRAVKRHGRGHGEWRIPAEEAERYLEIAHTVPRTKPRTVRRTVKAPKTPTVPPMPPRNL